LVNVRKVMKVSAPANTCARGARHSQRVCVFEYGGVRTSPTFTTFTFRERDSGFPQMWTKPH
jgi:hypothetical protein